MLSAHCADTKIKLCQTDAHFLFSELYLNGRATLSDGYQTKKKKLYNVYKCTRASPFLVCGLKKKIKSADSRESNHCLRMLATSISFILCRMLLLRETKNQCIAKAVSACVCANVCMSSSLLDTCRCNVVYTYMQVGVVFKR